MKELRALSPAELERRLERLRNPKPGGRVAAAIEFGIDVTLLMEQLKLSPADRVKKMEGVSRLAAELRGIGRRGGA